LQHAATLLPMAGDIQAVLNSQTAGVSDFHAWGLMLSSSSRVSPIPLSRGSSAPRSMQMYQGPVGAGKFRQEGTLRGELEKLN